MKLNKWERIGSNELPESLDNEVILHDKLTPQAIHIFNIANNLFDDDILPDVMYTNPIKCYKYWYVTWGLPNARTFGSIRLDWSPTNNISVYRCKINKPFPKNYKEK